MLDQLFTAENFRRIYDLENRKGHDLAARFFPELEPHTQAVRDKSAALKKLRAAKPAAASADIAAAMKELAEQKKEKSAAIDALLEEVSLKALSPQFRIKLSTAPGPGGKPVYFIEELPETYFVVKQLQRNINRLYRVKQANRHELVSQIRATLEDGFPYEVIRTDLSAFFESIDRKRLIEKLERDQLVSASSKKYIKQILEAYGALAHTTEGIPRGVGISAYLAELYLRPFDREVKVLPGLVLYSRYVDDILAIFARPPADAAGASTGRFASLMSGHSLQANAAKTKSFDLSSSLPVKFEYLGYRFHLKGKALEISPSSKKLRKYKVRLQAAFDTYYADRHVNTRRAYRELVARIKFLTGNTRLANSKSSAVTGVYFNNSLANHLRGLGVLDKLLKRKVKAVKVKNLRNRLKPFSFVSGFEQRRFHNFSTKELHRIVAAWKNAET